MDISVDDRRDGVGRLRLGKRSLEAYCMCTAPLLNENEWPVPAAAVWSSMNASVIECIPNNLEFGMEKGPLEDAEPADHAWENHRRLITTLYTSWSLEEVQRHLQQHHGFRASYVPLIAQRLLRLISQ
jgi:Clr5 domain